MKTLTQGAIVSSAIAWNNKWSVYIANHIDDFENSYEWQYLTEVINNKYPNNANDILFDAISAAVYCFDNEVEAVEFYKIFESGPLYASGIYAVLYDNVGMPQTENT